MALSMRAAASRGTQLLDQLGSERARLDPVRLYWKGRQRLPAVIPKSAPVEVREMARISRVNVVDIVVTSLVQSLIVEGIRASQLEDPNDPESPNVDALVDPVWDVWQANKLDKRQGGITAAAVAYGRAFGVVVPGVQSQRDASERPTPVVRGVSPRRMAALYEDGPDWPTEALERIGGGRYNLYDNEAVYPLQWRDDRLEAAGEVRTHGFGVSPVVRYEAEDDLDQDDEPVAENPVGHGFDLPMDVVMGQVAPLADIQDQVDVITFNLMVAQHYGAFRQRYIMGWLAKSESDLLKVGAQRILAFEDHPDDLQVGEFAQTDTRSHLDNREATIRHLATVSQTPVHELAGTFINMSADALEAARASHTAAGDENRMMAGESWEQALNLAGTMAGIEPDPSATVIWRDTTVRSLAESARALGELADRLHVPGRALWSRIPRVAQHELEQWAAMADESDPVDELMAMLSRQSQGAL